MNHNNCNQPGEADFNFDVNEYIGDGFHSGTDDVIEDLNRRKPSNADATYINFDNTNDGENEVYG